MGKKRKRARSGKGAKEGAKDKKKAPKRNFSYLDLLLIFIPIGIILHFIQDDELVVFATAAIAIIPLAGLMGRATEALAHHTTPRIGGLLNATFGNATELIIALIAIKAAAGAADEATRTALFNIVKASITGSIIGNILLILGLSMLLGGLKYKVQKFSASAAQMASTVMTLAVIAMLIPSLWGWFPDFTVGGAIDEATAQNVSNMVAVVMIILYILSLVFSLKTHKEFLHPAQHKGKEAEDGPHGGDGHVAWSKRMAFGILVVTTILVALMAELLVGSIEGATHTLGLTELFVGIVIIAIVGNAAEHSSAILLAMKDKMDISLTIAAGSSTQIALLVTPILVFASIAFGSPMTLVFFPFEVIALIISVVIMNMVSLDGKSNWFEGCELVAVYFILCVMFYFIPAH